MKPFKDKVKALLTHLETKHEEHPCIVLFDETQLVLGDLILGKSNWTDLCFGSNNCHVIFCFSPLQKYCGDYVYVKLSESFYSKTFKRGYRNSQKIQQLTEFLSKNNGNPLNLHGEENFPCVQGEQPVWIDMGSNHDDIGDAVRKLKSYTSKYPKEQVMLLYDEALDEVMIRKLRDSWDEGWTDQQVCRETMFQWKDYIGCECDAVVYVTSGDGSFLPGVRFWIFITACLGVVAGALNGAIVCAIIGAIFGAGNGISAGVGALVGASLGVFAGVPAVVSAAAGAASAVTAVAAGTVAADAGVAVGVSAIFSAGVGGVAVAAGAGDVIGAVIGAAVGATLGAGICASPGFASVPVVIVAVISAILGAGFLAVFIPAALNVIIAGITADVATIAGYHAAISRARYFTGIITVNKDGVIRSSYRKLSSKLG